MEGGAAKLADAVDDFFAGYPPEPRAISRKLRTMARRAMPGANEILFASQNHVAYSTGQSRAGTIVYICPLKDYVRLGFMFGTSLPDPQGMLVGEGKRLRHVKVWHAQDADDPALEQLVEAAWAEAEPLKS
jgi:hypothetical protein